MKVADLSHERLRELVERFPTARLAVVGDFFLDKYLDVDPALEEPSLETGKPAHQVVGVRISPGAAGTVICNLAALGARAMHAIGLLGNDGEGFDLRGALDALGSSTEHLHRVHDRYTPTYLKPRNIREATLAGEHSRYDTKNRTPTSAYTEQRILQSIDCVLGKTDALIIMDQVDEADCGVVTRTLRAALAQRAAAHPGVIFWADSRRHIHEFRGVIVKPNQFEALGGATARPDQEVDAERLRVAVQRLRSQVGAPVVATRGRLGMAVSDPEWTLVPAVKLQGPIDPTGAGDSATAGAVIALCAGASLPEAAVIGNLVASITVQQIGTTGVARPEQLADRLDLWHKQRKDEG